MGAAAYSQTQEEENPEESGEELLDCDPLEYADCEAAAIDEDDEGPDKPILKSGKPSRRYCFHWSCCISCGCYGFVLLWLIVQVILGTLKRSGRASELEPFLAACQSSLYCSRSTDDSACHMEFTSSEAKDFNVYPAENRIVGFLYAQVANKTGPTMSEIARGAHISVNDPMSKIYDFIKSSELPTAVQRLSSHESDVLQYGLKLGRVLSTLLMGRVGNRTWFQLEGSPFHSPSFSMWMNGQNVAHGLDYIEYRLSGNNVGPMGASVHTDQMPLRLESISWPSTSCPTKCPGEDPYPTM